ncbi:MAG: DUF58 domain-containing protein [Thermodesulfobacteriota bacterium]
MNLRPAISAPLPWLTVIAGRFLAGLKKDAGKGVKRRLLKFPRSLRVTREGKWFIAVLFSIGLAAINTGSNLLYLMLTTLLSMIIISGLMSESTLKGLRAVRLPPGKIFRGTPALFAFKIENTKRFFSSISFDLSESALPGIDCPPVYVLKLKAGASIIRGARYTFKKRGRYTLTGLKFTTLYPFGLFLKGKVEALSHEVTVYPRIKPVHTVASKTISSREGARVKKKGAGPDLHNLRDYTPHDDSRFIHWKSAAVTGGLMVKEFERESEKKVLVRFQNLSRPGYEALFEDTVDEVAGVISFLIEEGYSVVFETLEEELPPGTGREHFFRILGRLALIKPKPLSSGTPAYDVVYL